MTLNTPPDAPKTGVKFDQGKLGFNLLPWDAVIEIVRVLDYGATKYDARNWEKGMDWSRPESAAYRHLTAWSMGESLDPDTGLSHLAHAACNLLFLLAYAQRGIGHDDRPR